MFRVDRRRPPLLSRLLTRFETLCIKIPTVDSLKWANRACRNQGNLANAHPRSGRHTYSEPENRKSEFSSPAPALLVLLWMAWIEETG